MGVFYLIEILTRLDRLKWTANSIRIIEHKGAHRNRRYNKRNRLASRHKLLRQTVLPEHDGNSAHTLADLAGI